MISWKRFLSGALAGLVLLSGAMAISASAEEPGYVPSARLERDTNLVGGRGLNENISEGWISFSGAIEKYDGKGHMIGVSVLPPDGVTLTSGDTSEITVTVGNESYTAAPGDVIADGDIPNVSQRVNVFAVVEDVEVMIPVTVTWNDIAVTEQFVIDIESCLLKQDTSFITIDGAFTGKHRADGTETDLAYTVSGNTLTFTGNVDYGEKPRVRIVAPKGVEPEVVGFYHSYVDEEYYSRGEIDEGEAIIDVPVEIGKITKFLVSWDGEDPTETFVVDCTGCVEEGIPGGGEKHDQTLTDDATGIQVTGNFYDGSNVRIYVSSKEDWELAFQNPYDNFMLGASEDLKEKIKSLYGDSYWFDIFAPSADYDQLKGMQGNTTVDVKIPYAKNAENLKGFYVNGKIGEKMRAIPFDVEYDPQTGIITFPMTGDMLQGRLIGFYEDTESNSSQVPSENPSENESSNPQDKDSSSSQVEKINNNNPKTGDNATKLVSLLVGISAGGIITLSKRKK